MKEYTCVFLLIFIFITSSCSLGPPPNTPVVNNEATDTTVITFGTDSPELYAPIIERFNNQYPNIKAQIVPIPLPNGSSVEIARTVAQAADVSIAFGIDTAEVWDSGVLLDLKPFIDADRTFQSDDYYLGVLDQASYKGRLYRIPHQVRVPLFQYNKQLWHQRNLSPPDNNQTWQDVIRAATQIAHTQPDGTHVYGIAAGQNGFDLFLSLLAEQGIDPFSEQEVALESDKIAQVLMQMRQLTQNGVLYLGPQTGVMDYDSLIDQQQIGIWLNFSYNGLAYHDPKHFEIGAFPLPTTSILPDLLPSEQSLVMSAGTQHAQEAWMLLSFLSRNLPPEDASAVPPAVRALPARRSLLEQLQVWPQMDSDPEARAALQLALSRPIPASLVRNVTPVRYVTLDRLLNAVVAEGLSIEQGIAAAKDAAAQTQATWPTPLPTTGSLPVNTPIPQHHNPDAETIAFDMGGLDQVQLQMLAFQFQHEHPNVLVTLEQASSAPDCFAQHSALRNPSLQALDLQPFLDRDQNFNQTDYPSAWWESYRHDGKMTGIPLEIVVRWMAYQRETVAAGGVQIPDTNWSLETLQTTVAQLSQIPSRTTPQTFAIVDRNPEITIPFFLGRLGASFWRIENGQRYLQYTDPNVVQALRAYVDLMRDSSPTSQTPASPIIMEPSQKDQLFADKHVALWFEFAPFPASGASSEIGIVAPPFGTDGLTVDDFSVLGLHIAAQTDHAEACWQWITFLSKNAAAVTPGTLPARRSLAADPVLAQQVGAEVSAVYARYIDLAQRPLASTTPNLVLDRYQTHWLNQAIQQALQGQSLEPALEKAQRTTEEYLRCLRDAQSAETCATQADPSFAPENK